MTSRWLVLYAVLFCGASFGCKSLSLEEVRGDLELPEVTPLMQAAGGDDLEAAREAIEKAADVNARSEEMRTPLHFAVQGGSPRIVELLLQRGADVAALDDFLLTPLHFAALKGEVEIVQRLVDAGSRINQTDGFGRTPLHHAASVGHTDIAMFLVSRGAEVVPLEGSPGELEATATSYLVAATVLEQQGRAAGAAYSDAAAYFARTASEYDALAEEAGAQVTAERTRLIVGSILLVAAQGLQQWGAQVQADMQARQMAEISALQHASSSGTGVAGYHNALRNYEAVYRSAPVAQPLAPTASLYGAVGRPTIRGGSIAIAEQQQKAYESRAEELRASAARAQALAEGRKIPDDDVPSPDNAAPGEENS